MAGFQAALAGRQRFADFASDAPAGVVVPTSQRAICNYSVLGTREYMAPDAGDLFGHNVSLLGDTLAIGAHGQGSNPTDINGNQADNSAKYSGAVYVLATPAM